MQATVHGVAKSQARLSDFTFTFKGKGQGFRGSGMPLPFYPFLSLIYSPGCGRYVI